MIGLEIVDPNRLKDRLGRYPASSALAKAVKEECFNKGVIVEAGGRHGSVIRLLPPLVISDDELEQVIATLRTAVATVSRLL
jgi:diaminobutyrate-2-oxoglutarate transaminase